jgi:hypothetical protein
MAHVLLLNLVFFIPATCGATAFAFIVYRFFAGAPPAAASPPGGGSNVSLPEAGPDDLASAA